MEITKKLYNGYCRPKYFNVEKYFKSWDPKIKVPRNYLQVFMRPLLLMNAGTRIFIHMQCFKMVSQRIQDDLIKEQ